MMIELDPQRHVAAVTGQRDRLLSENAELRRRIMDLEVIVDSLLADEDDDASE